MADSDLAEVWARSLDGLADLQIQPHQRAWLKLTRPLGLVENTALIATPNEFVKEQLETRLRPLVTQALSQELGRDIQLAVTVDPAPQLGSAPGAPVSDLAAEAAAPLTAEHPGRPAADRQPEARADGSFVLGPGRAAAGARRPRAPWHQPAGRRARRAPGLGGARLNSKYTFETFVIGSSNRFAHAAAVAVAEAPAKAYNPLFVYGESGLGKTHLLHAIGHYAQRDSGRKRVVTSPGGVHQRLHQLHPRRQAWSASAAGTATWTSCWSTTSSSSRARKAPRRSSSTPSTPCTRPTSRSSSPATARPSELVTLEDRLRTRFEWGLLTDIQPPDLETRIAILRAKATRKASTPAEVLEYIASRISTNIRELEGALIRVTAFASLNRQSVDLQLAEIVLKDLIPRGGPPQITRPPIMGQTASYFGLSIEDLCGTPRPRVLVTARHIAMYLCRELTDLSLPKIGQQFGRRDHTTVIQRRPQDPLL